MDETPITLNPMNEPSNVSADRLYQALRVLVEHEANKPGGGLSALVALASMTGTVIASAPDHMRDAMVGEAMNRIHEQIARAIMAGPALPTVQ